MPDGLCAQLDALLCLPVALLAVAAVVRRSLRACRNCGAVDCHRRAWVFCPRCGSPRGETYKDRAPPPGTKTATIPLVTTDEPIPVLPSDLLRRGWRRDEAALDDCGHEVAPNDEHAVAWSLLGACDSAWEPHSARWRAWRKALDEIMAERYGGVSPRVWARHPARRHQIVVELAQEIERRLGIARDSGRSATNMVAQSYAG